MKAAKRSDWQIRALPPNRCTIRLDRHFSLRQFQRMQSGVIPEQMEDKWFIYWRDGTLFFHRSWTGFCIYAVRFAADSDGYRMVEADVNRDPKQYSEADDGLDAKLISYLIDLLLLRQAAEFPDAEPDSGDAAVKKWSYVGRAMLGEHPRSQ